jgi:hypothetical protein
MTILQGNPLNFNKNLSFTLEGGNLSSDSGLLHVRSFIEKLGLYSGLIFKTQNSDFLMNLIYVIN